MSEAYYLKYGHYPDGGRGMPKPPFPRYHNEHICIMCGDPLMGRKQTYCSNICSTIWFNEYSWDGMKRRVFERDSWTCVKCGYIPKLQILKCTDKTDRTFVDGYNLLHCHHIKPLTDGGKTALDNLQSLCTKCHIKTHRGMGSLNSNAHKQANQCKKLSEFLEATP